MGRLFTYMVKAAAGQQPLPTYNYFTPLGSKNRTWGTEDYDVPYGYNGGVTTKWNAVDNLYSSSADIDAWQALNAGGGNNWGTAYATAVNPAFTSPEAVARFLDEHPEYERELIRFAQFGGDYANFRDGGPGAPSLKDISNSPFALNGGRGNVRLALNLAKAYREAAAKQAAEEAAKAEQKQIEDATRDKQGADAEVVPNGSPQPGPQPQADPKPVAPVQAPVIPKGTSVVTDPDGKQYVSSTDERKAQTAAGIGALLEARQNPFTGVSTTAPGASGPTRVTMDAGQAAVRNQINSNIASGQSMYSNMGDAGKFMTEAQRSAMNAAEPYENSGLRMVGHSADGNTQTYVGRSGRGRITVGARDTRADAAAGHYRGVGSVDTNPRSNYANLRQPNATRPVTPPTVSSVRKSTTAPRR